MGTICLENYLLYQVAINRNLFIYLNSHFASFYFISTHECDLISQHGCLYQKQAELSSLFKTCCLKGTEVTLVCSISPQVFLLFSFTASAAEDLEIASSIAIICKYLVESIEVPYHQNIQWSFPGFLPGCAFKASAAFCEEQISKRIWL